SIRQTSAISAFVRGLDWAARAHDRAVDIHLNSASPPWSSAVSGPLFSVASDEPPSSVDIWFDAISNASPRLRVVWRRRDNDDSLSRRLAATRRSWRVVFDRPGQPIALSHGITRNRPAILTTIGLDLPRLLNRPDVSCQADAFLTKLPSLVRLA